MGAKLITSKGKEISLSQLKTVTAQIIPVQNPGKDYQGGRVTIAGKNYINAIAAEPSKVGEADTITVDLSGLDAIRFVAEVGGDSPVGDEDQIRKTVSFRTRGTEVSYLSLIEPYEKNSMIMNIVSTYGKTILIRLKDGRSQRIRIKGIDSENGKIAVEITEEKVGTILRQEKAEN